jgi:hypothetical protein
MFYFPREVDWKKRDIGITSKVLWIIFCRRIPKIFKKLKLSLYITYF